MNKLKLECERLKATLTRLKRAEEEMEIEASCSEILKLSYYLGLLTSPELVQFLIDHLPSPAGSLKKLAEFLAAEEDGVLRLQLSDYLQVKLLVRRAKNTLTYKVSVEKPSPEELSLAECWATNIGRLTGKEIAVMIPEKGEKTHENR